MKENEPHDEAVCPKALDVAFSIAHESHESSKIAPGKRGRLYVGPAEELVEGVCKTVDEGKLSIGVYRIKGEFYAIRNLCPHQGAALCKGPVGSTHAPSEVNVYRPDLEGRVVRCPWHGWEFDIPSGKGLYDRRARVKTYRCVVDEAGGLWVEI